LPPAATVQAVPTLARGSAVDANNVAVMLSAPGKRRLRALGSERFNRAG
jgi:hypothetical protein